jgi:glutathione S-transferase
MKLVGMIDSPFVRRLAVVMTARGIPFEHEAVSVFRHMDRFRAINPVIKAPTLVTDEGVVLMESSVIFHWLEGVAGGSFLPMDAAERARAACLPALGLPVMEKAVQIEYERKRPEAIRHAPWFDRIKDQLATALAECEAELGAGAPDPLAMDGATLAVGWSFTAHITHEDADRAAFPRFAAYTDTAEDLPAYRRWPIEG